RPRHTGHTPCNESAHEVRQIVEALAGTGTGLDGHDGERRATFLAADEADALAGGRLDVDGVERDAQAGSDRGAHVVAVLPEARALEDHGRVAVHDREAA